VANPWYSRYCVNNEGIMKQPHSHERGFALLATGVCGVVIFGMAGLAIDLGRMYITKNEV
jgi:hypothetical protein